MNIKYFQYNLGLNDLEDLVEFGAAKCDSPHDYMTCPDLHNKETGEASVMVLNGNASEDDYLAISA